MVGVDEQGDEGHQNAFVHVQLAYQRRFSLAEHGAQTSVDQVDGCQDYEEVDHVGAGEGAKVKR